MGVSCCASAAAAAAVSVSVAQEVAVNQPDLTAEECVAAVWAEFNVDAGYSTAGLKYAILPTGITSATQWLLRLPWLGEGYIRPKILNRSSKL